MVFQTFSNIAKCRKLNILPSLQHRLWVTLSGRSFSDNSPPGPDQTQKKPERLLREWREPLERNPYNAFDIVSPEHAFFKFFQKDIELTPWGVTKFIKKKRDKAFKDYQTFQPMRHQILGADLAFGHFLTFLGGKVKYKGNNNWVTINEDKKSVNLPNAFDSKYIVSEFDASDIELFYEGLKNFENLPKVKRGSFARSPLFDDWYMDKVSHMFPLLEYLDVSECPKLTERGLESLYRAANLQTLIITDYHGSAAFALTCMMLEDVLPNLKIVTLKPKEKPSINIDKM